MLNANDIKEDPNSHHTLDNSDIQNPIHQNTDQLSSNHQNVWEEFDHVDHVSDSDCHVLVTDNDSDSDCSMSDTPIPINTISNSPSLVSHKRPDTPFSNRSLGNSSRDISKKDLLISPTVPESTDFAYANSPLSEETDTDKVQEHKEINQSMLLDLYQKKITEIEVHSIEHKDANKEDANKESFNDCADSNKSNKKNLLPHAHIPIKKTQIEHKDNEEQRQSADVNNTSQTSEENLKQHNNRNNESFSYKKIGSEYKKQFFDLCSRCNMSCGVCMEKMRDKLPSSLKSDRAKKYYPVIGHTIAAMLTASFCVFLLKLTGVINTTDIHNPTIFVPIAVFVVIVVLYAGIYSILKNERLQPLGNAPRSNDNEKLITQDEKPNILDQPEKETFDFNIRQK